MGYIDRKGMAVANRRQELIQEPFIRTATPREAFRVAFDETTEMGLLSSKRTLIDRAQSWQRDALKSAYDRGEIPDDVWQSKRDRHNPGKIDWAGLAKWSNENLNTEYDFSWENVAEGALKRTQERQAVQSTYDITSPQAVMSFLGTAAAMFNPAKPIDFIVSTGFMFLPGPKANPGSGVMGAALRAGFHEARLGLMEEGLTQATVYNLRKEIGDEYRLSDAALSMFIAATIPGLIGGAFGAAKQPRVIAEAEEMAKKAAQTSSANELRNVIDAMLGEVRKVEQSRLNKIERSPMMPVRPAPFIPDDQTIRDQILELAREELTPAAGEKLSRGEVKQIERELADLRYKIENVPDTPSPPSRDLNPRYTSKRRQKIEEERRGKRLAQQQRDQLQARIDILERKLARQEEAAAAAADLSRIEQGIVPESWDDIFQEQLATRDRMLEQDAEPSRLETITGVRETLTPRQRAAVDELVEMRDMLDEIDFEKAETMTAAEAQAWLQGRRLAVEEIQEELPSIPDSVRREIEEEIDEAVPLGEPDVPPVDPGESAADVINRSQTTVDVKLRDSDTVARLVRKEEGGEVVRETTTWGEVKAEEAARLQDVYDRLDNFRACAMGGQE